MGKNQLKKAYDDTTFMDLIVLKRSGLGILHLVSMQNFPKNKHFFDSHIYICVSGGKKC